ncbi:MAG: hypothetical protein NXH90_02655 [Flavobacteriaceae bacterium]|nr:hypothetical protein [Flavobacteriaceae bacterium]
MRLLKFLCFVILIGCGKEDEVICLSYTPEISDQYIFPIRPGMQEWEKLTSGQQMIEALQVPDNLLKDMSSFGLVETCLDYPLLPAMIAFDTIQYGVERQMENFNGFHELVTREDAGSIMLGRSKQMNPRCIPPSSEIMAGEYTLTFIYIGMVQSQYVFIEQLSSIERGELLKEAMKKYNQFEIIGEPYGILNQKVEALLMARVMVSEGYKPFLEEIARNDSMDIFIKYVELDNREEILNKILDYATKYKTL